MSYRVPCTRNVSRNQNFLSLCSGELELLLEPLHLISGIFTCFYQLVEIDHVSVLSVQGYQLEVWGQELRVVPFIKRLTELLNWGIGGKRWIHLFLLKLKVKSLEAKLTTCWWESPRTNHTLARGTDLQDRCRDFQSPFFFLTKVIAYKIKQKKRREVTGKIGVFG